MTDVQSADKATLLATFNETFEKIVKEGAKHAFPQKGFASGCDIKRISSTAAWVSGDARELGAINSCGIVTPFAKVNGRGYVETVGDVSERQMETMLTKTGRHIAQCTPSKGEGSMYHYSVTGPRKVF